MGVDQRMGTRKSDHLIMLLKMALWPKEDAMDVLKVRHFRKALSRLTIQTQQKEAELEGEGEAVS